MANKLFGNQKPEDNISIKTGLMDGLKKPESLTPKQRKTRENLSRFSKDLGFNPLELYEAWLLFRYQENLPYDTLVYTAKIPLKTDPHVWKNHKLYTIEKDEEGYQYVKRYKATWNY
jgi:hypothetical protein